MVRNMFRRLERLETRVRAAAGGTIEIRILLVHPEKGLTGALVLGANGTTKEPGTPEEKERIRAELEQRRAARLQWKGGTADTHDYAPA